MVVTVAQLHGYLTELLEEWADLLGSDLKKLSPIGRRYVMVQVWRTLSDAIEEHPEDDMGDSKAQAALAQRLEETVKWLDDPRELARAPARPRVEGFFRQWGASAIERTLTHFRDDGTKFFTWLREQHHAYDDFYVRVNAAIDVRNEVAHGELRTRLTLEDVRRHRATISLLVMKSELFVRPALMAARAAAAAP